MTVSHPPLSGASSGISGLGAAALVSRLRAWADRRRWLVAIVGLPTLLAALYMYLLAADQYVSESRFMVRSQAPVTNSLLGQMLGAAGGGSGEDAAGVTSFIGSQEFANRYGASPNNGALVDALYQNTLHRAGDAAGRAGWINALNGGLSRADLVVGFSESPEHVKNVIAADTATAKTSYGATYLADASAHLGSIPVIPTASLV